MLAEGVAPAEGVVVRVVVVPDLKAPAEVTRGRAFDVVGELLEVRPGIGTFVAERVRTHRVGVSPHPAEVLHR